MALSARDFWDRISPRERKLVVFLAAVVPLALAIWLGLSIRDGLISMDDRNERTRDALTRVAKMKAAGGPVEDPGVKIPDNAVPLETYVTKAVEKAGLKFKGPIDSRPKITKNGFVTTTVSCAVDDVSTDQLKTFLQEIESGEKVVVVTHVDIKRDWKDKKKIDATFEISTYSNAEKTKKEEGEGSGSAVPAPDSKKGG
jgi:Type II secretion system (T2SS), protein M